MSSSDSKRGLRFLVFVPLIALCALVAVIAVTLFGWGYVGVVLHGPEIVLSVPSPDGEYEAYVEEAPSIDPPNQSLFVERKDKVHFMRIADLAEDVDSIKEVVWSPDSGVVVFHSHRYLTVTRVSDWRTVRVYLGREWTRSRPQRWPTTFASGG